MGGWSVGCENRAAFRMKRLQSPHRQCAKPRRMHQQPQKIESHRERNSLMADNERDMTHSVSDRYRSRLTRELGCAVRAATR